jgi:hypothetical protein
MRSDRRTDSSNVIHRSAQVVRNVRRESRNALERLFQPVQHLVEGLGERCQLKRISLRKNAFSQVRRTDMARGRRHFLHRTNAMPCSLVSDQWENDESRQQNGPEPKPKASQQFLFLRDVNRDLNSVTLNCRGTDGHRRASHAKGLAFPALHPNGPIRAASRLTR